MTMHQEGTPKTNWTYYDPPKTRITSELQTLPQGKIVLKASRAVIGGPPPLPVSPVLLPSPGRVRRSRRRTVILVTLSMVLGLLSSFGVERQIFQGANGGNTQSQVATKTTLSGTQPIVGGTTHATSTPLLQTPGTTSSPTSVPGTTTVIGPPITILAQDTFTRPNQAYWGLASDGQPWQGDTTTNTVFSIQDGIGSVSRGNGYYNAVIGPEEANSTVICSGVMSSFHNASMGTVLRWRDAFNWYKAFIDGTTLYIEKRVNGRITVLQSTVFQAQAALSYTIRFHAAGTLLETRVWLTGTVEPIGWMVTANDTTFASGLGGLRIGIQTPAQAFITTFTETNP